MEYIRGGLMSQLTQCNYCSMKGIRLRSTKKKTEVIIQSAINNQLGGFNIYVRKKGERLNHKKHFVCWMMELTEYCVC